MTEKNDNTIFVGKKPLMSYVLAVVTQFGDGIKEVHIKARGKSISSAVDIAQIVKNKFVKDVNIDKVEIGTDKVENEGKELNVSTIDILLKK